MWDKKHERPNSFPEFSCKNKDEIVLNTRVHKKKKTIAFKLIKQFKRWRTLSSKCSDVQLLYSGASTQKVNRNLSSKYFSGYYF